MARQFLKITVKAVDGEAVVSTYTKLIPVQSVRRIRQNAANDDSYVSVDEGGIDLVVYTADETVSTLAGQMPAGWDLTVNVVARDKNNQVAESNCFPVGNICAIGLAEGKGAVLTAVLDIGVDDDKLASVTITNAGEGYTDGAVTLEFSGGAGTGAAATAKVIDGKIASVTITNVGSGYTSAPTITVHPGSSLKNKENGPVPNVYTVSNTLAAVESAITP